MGIDELPHQFEAFLNRARAVFDGEVERVQKALAASNAEKASAQSALADLQSQCKSAQDQLELTTSELRRAAGLVGVGHDIEKARTELAGLKAETAKAAKALEARLKQCTEADARLVALGNEAQRMVAIRVEGESVMANLRAQLRSVQMRTIQP
jgi:chromosome segregation ATPase